VLVQAQQLLALRFEPPAPLDSGPREAGETMPTAGAKTMPAAAQRGRGASRQGQARQKDSAVRSVRKLGQVGQLGQLGRPDLAG
jgi:hypothetical protein